MNQTPQQPQCSQCGSPNTLVGALSNHFLLSQQWFKGNDVLLAQFTVESIACTECGAVTTRLTEAARKDLASRLKWQRIESERKRERKQSAEQ